MKKIIKSKKFVIIVSVLLLLGIVIGALLYFNKDYIEKVNGLEITYYGRDKVKIKKIEDGYVLEKKIVVKNTTSDLKTYSFEWKDIENDFDKQSSLLYEISSTGERAAELEKSQLPGAESIIFPSVAIPAGKTHAYIVKIWYDGNTKSEKDSIFVGKLDVDSEVVKEEIDEIDESNKQDA